MSSPLCSHHDISSIPTDSSTPSLFRSMSSLLCSHHVISSIPKDPPDKVHSDLWVPCFVLTMWSAPFQQTPAHQVYSDKWVPSFVLTMRQVPGVGYEVSVIRCLVSAGVRWLGTQVYLKFGKWGWPWGQLCHLWGVYKYQWWVSSGGGSVIHELTTSGFFLLDFFIWREGTWDLLCSKRWLYETGHPGLLKQSIIVWKLIHLKNAASILGVHQ